MLVMEQRITQQMFGELVVCNLKSLYKYETVPNYSKEQFEKSKKKPRNSSNTNCEYNSNLTKIFKIYWHD